MATSRSVIVEDKGAGTIATTAGCAIKKDIPVKSTQNYVYISGNKLRYFNDAYQKISEKMYDYSSDITLKVGHANFQVHRTVLSDASDYFAAMFTHEMKEKEEAEIELKEISPAGFTAMMDYFYHGNVTVDEKTVADVLEAGRFFHVEWILDIGCDYLIRHLSMLNFALTMELADTYSLGDLRWDIFKHFGSNLSTLIQKDDFYEDLSVDLLFQFLMEDIYVDETEFFLLQLILRWVEVNEERRTKHLLPLLQQLRFPTMKMEELANLPAQVLQYRDLRDKVEDAKSYALDIPGQCLKTEDKYLRRGSRPTVVVSAYDYDTETSLMIVKDPENVKANLFVEQLESPDHRSDYTTMSQTFIGNFLFAAISYNDESKSTAGLFRFDAFARKWMQVATMSEPRISCAMCSSMDKLYVVGGVLLTNDDSSVETILPSVEAYNPHENVFVNLPKLPHGSFDQAAAHCHGKLYVSGGISELDSHPEPLPYVYVLSDGDNHWAQLPSLLTARQGHSMTPFGAKLIVLGGYTCKPGSAGFKDCETNEVFDMETQQWTAILSTPENYGHLYRHVGLYENKIYFLCNKDANIFLNSYDIGKDQFHDGVAVRGGAHKVGILKLAYPRV